MTLEDLSSYEVIWDEPLVANIGTYQIYTNRPPNDGGVNMIEAQQLAVAAGLGKGPHWTTSAAALKKALDISQVNVLGYLPATLKSQLYPGLDFSHPSRTSPAFAQDLWKRMQAGASPFRWKAPAGHHSDDVVAIDKDGNIAAITQSINCVDWGRTAINIDGISIGDPGSFQQAAIARTGPGRAAARTHRDRHPVQGRRAPDGLRFHGFRPASAHLPGAGQRDALRHDRGRSHRRGRFPAPRNRT